MSEQLQLGLEPTERRYECCDRPAPPLGQRAYPDFPHAEDCPNPNVGHWVDRWGRPLRRLWCSDKVRLTPPGERVCPYAEGKVPMGVCCLQLVKE